MDKIILESSMATDITMVSNLFIDVYMPKANGDFVKVYMYLLRHLSSGDANLNPASMADVFNFTERDVIRAFRYWESVGLLTITRDDTGIIKGIRLEPFGSDSHYIKGVQSMQMIPDNTTEEIDKITLPVKKSYTKEEIKNFSQDNNIGQLMFVAQAYLAKPLSSVDINSLLYMYDSLSLSAEYIEYLLESCIDENHKSLSYVEKSAVYMYEHGITDIKDAKKFKTKSHALDKKVLKAFGITGRQPGKDEKDFILKWQVEYGYSDDMIVEACNRTISHTHNASFSYANSILASWYKNGARKLSDVEKLDKQHTEEMTAKYNEKKNSTTKQVSHKGGHKIDEHDCDLKELERALLQGR